MQIPLDELKRFVRNCDPAIPILDTSDPKMAEMYEELDDVRGDHDIPCVAALQERIDMSSNGCSCQLFTGFQGTGKTTELRRLKRKLENAPDVKTVCVFVDFQEWIDTLAPMSIAQILAVIAHAFDREATRLEGNDPDESKRYLQRFWSFLSGNDAEFKKVEFDAFGTKLLFEVKDNGHFRQRVEEVITRRFRRFADEAHLSVDDSIARMRHAVGTEDARIVFIADGLEKIRPVRYEDQEKIDASVESVFVSNASFLRIPCHAIYTFPVSLPSRTAALGTLYDDEPFILPMVKVHGQDERLTYNLGVDKLVSLLGKRLDLKRIFGDDPSTTLLPIILNSGGYLRDLLRMVRPLLRPRFDYPIKLSETTKVIDRLAETYRELVDARDLDLLVDIANTHSRPQGDLERRVAFGHLLERHLVLVYRNGTTWYDLHPLIRHDPTVKQRIKENR